MQRVMEDYKEKQDLLILENSELRESLYKMQYELARLSHLSEASTTTSSKSVLLPSEISRESVQHSCDRVLKAVAERYDEKSAI